MMIDGTVVAITTVEAGEAALVEVNGEVVAIAEEEEDIGEVAVKVEEVEDTGEAAGIGEGEEAEEEEGVVQEAAPFLPPLMMMMWKWETLT